ncbi:MAG TPA: hypothetical protein VJO99_03355 [Burkholderiaceae bacterium]|nr:hypothetical protein [Burkholderiaceae bacterium]
MSDLSFTNWFPWLPSAVDERFNNGWTFGNIYVTQANSRSPEAEREIVGRYSYGRQLGRLTDAVVALAAKAGASHDENVEPLVEMAKQINAIKETAKKRHAAELLAELKAIKRADPKAWAALLKSVGE